MFFNNAVANFSQASAGGAPTGPFNYDPMSDSDLGASSACLGITPLQMVVGVQILLLL